MAKNQPPLSVKDAVYRIQLSLLQGVSNENQLFAAGSVISRSDYNDVVTERALANLCGNPLCSKSLPSDRPRKGRYRISLKEHKVYDLQETYMYCSSDCVINSGTFGRSLSEDRCSVLDSSKIEAVLGLIGDSSEISEVGLGKDWNLGFSKLTIKEKTETHVGELNLEEWVGPSNAIEGYVPQRERNFKPVGSKTSKKGSKPNNAVLINDMDFVSTLITEDEYTVSKTPLSSKNTGFDIKLKQPKENLGKKEMENQFTLLDTSHTPMSNDLERKTKQLEGGNCITVSRDELGIQEVPSTSSSSQLGSHSSSGKVGEVSKRTKKLTEATLKSSLKASRKNKLSRSVTWADEKTDSCGKINLCEVREIEDKKEATSILGKTGKVSLKPSGSLKASTSSSLADEKCDTNVSKDACEVRETKDMNQTSDMLSKDIGDDDVLRLASAEACVNALNEASEAVSAGEFEVSDAMSEAGIIILPRPENVNEGKSLEDNDTSEPEQAPLKWPKKPGNQHSDVFNPEDSWFDAPPEGFSLNLSHFAQMWNALFTWTTSSTLAYIYGRDESLHQEYLSVNGREYPQKIVLGDGRSSEIKQTLAGSLARALPGLVADLRLPIPVSSLEQGMGRLLETMSFVDALPPFRIKQWQVIVLLFIEALSVCRLPALIPHMTHRRVLFHKVLDGAQISAEEYEIMKDLMLPLGQTPHLSAQSGA
ncbi:putative RNA polymerase II subunit B1 CTD phosphatase RPAP2 homolog [Humulus lupulus]|uniref:putative RNA polymerase II subunit B1 CTD phosphatase RPAP2 homolog n=1 Tax=Humulus lupulus TaxID=3486 RepID=UPI002B416BFB|nr:putative RNA polymerase II subunit B1 CTD phosphatase RPAP2 homolog [Humulus lupulus]